MYRVSGVKLVQEAVDTFDPENNKFTTNKGEYTYDYLVVTIKYFLIIKNNRG